MFSGIYWAYAIGWFFMAIWSDTVYPSRKDKGYIGRLMKKLTVMLAGVRTDRWSMRWWVADITVFLVVMVPLGYAISLLLLAIGVDIHGAGIFIAYILKILDDILNGEDDGWKKRWEKAKNKVKWLWTPAQEPATKGVRA